jgi:hypothetical protein
MKTSRKLTFYTAQSLTVLNQVTFRYDSTPINKCTSKTGLYMVAS